MAQQKILEDILNEGKVDEAAMYDMNTCDTYLTLLYNLRESIYDLIGLYEQFNKHFNRGVGNPSDIQVELGYIRDALDNMNRNRGDFQKNQEDIIKRVKKLRSFSLENMQMTLNKDIEFMKAAMERLIKHNQSQPYRLLSKFINTLSNY